MSGDTCENYNLRKLRLTAPRHYLPSLRGGWNLFNLSRGDAFLNTINFADNVYYSAECKPNLCSAHPDRV